MPFGDVSTWIGSRALPDARAFAFRSATAACTRGSDASPLIATTAGSAPPGNASRTLLNDCTSFIDFGSASKPDCEVCRLSAGNASATSTAVAASAETSGRRSTRSSTAVHRRLSPSSRFSRQISGTRTLSTRSPSHESIAGRTVSEPIIATATTIIVPIAKDMNVLSPEKNMPAIAIITVKPEMSTARPEVAAAASSAADSLRPARRSSRSRRM